MPETRQFYAEGGRTNYEGRITKDEGRFEPLDKGRL